MLLKFFLLLEMCFLSSLSFFLSKFCITLFLVLLRSLIDLCFFPSSALSLFVNTGKEVGLVDLYCNTLNMVEQFLSSSHPSIRLFPRVKVPKKSDRSNLADVTERLQAEDQQLFMDQLPEDIRKI